MRTVTFQSVLYGVATAHGMDPARDLNPARTASFAEYINQRVLEGWKWEFWPEWTVSEQRAFRASYDATEPVAATDERFLPGAQNYYQALQASTGQAPATLTGTLWVENSAYWAICAQSYSGNDWATGTVFTVGLQVRNPDDNRFYQCHTAHTAGATFDATKFGLLTPFDKYVAYEQTTAAGVRLTPIDEVKQVCKRNPRVFPANPFPIAFRPSDAGIQFMADAPAQVWIEFRKRPPVFTSTRHSLTTTYALDDLAYSSTTGECYKSLQAANVNHAVTDAAWWERVQFPAVLASFVKRCASADALNDQKQTSRKKDKLDEAYAELQDAADRALAGQGQFQTATVVAYGG